MALAAEMKQRTLELQQALEAKISEEREAPDRPREAVGQLFMYERGGIWV